MSAKYYIYLESKLNVIDISNRLEEVDLTWNTLPQVYDNHIAKTCAHFSMSILQPSESLAKSLGETYQINMPSISCSFNYRGYSEYVHQAVLPVVQVLVFLLKELGGDVAFLLEDMSFTYLVRRSGKTLLTTGRSFWKDDPRRLDFIPTPYEWVEKLP